MATMAVRRSGTPERPADGHDAALAANESALAVIEAARHDPGAFEPLYRVYHPAVLAYCQRRLSDSHLAADATAQIFLKVLRSLPRFQPDPRRAESSFRSWLFAIAHNVVVDSYRFARSDLTLDQPPETALAYAGMSPEDAALISDDARELTRCLAQVPERQRAVIELRLAGCSRREIADALAMTEAAVRSAQFRGFATLRTLLSPHWYGPAGQDFGDSE